MILEHMGMIKFGVSSFLIGTDPTLDEIKESGKDIVILGTGYNAHLLSHFLADRKIEIQAYADNSSRLWGRTYLGKPVNRPKEIFERENTYIFIALAQENIRTARLQLMNHGIKDYSVFFSSAFHSFEYENKRLQEQLLKAINVIAFENEDDAAALPRNKIVLRRMGGYLESWTGY